MAAGGHSWCWRWCWGKVFNAHGLLCGACYQRAGDHHREAAHYHVVLTSSPLTTCSIDKAKTAAASRCNNIDAVAGEANTKRQLPTPAKVLPPLLNETTPLSFHYADANLTAALSKAPGVGIGVLLVGPDRPTLKQTAGEKAEAGSCHYLVGPQPHGSEDCPPSSSTASSSSRPLR